MTDKKETWICDRGCTKDKRQQSKKYPHLCKRCEREIDQEAQAQPSLQQILDQFKPVWCACKIPNLGLFLDDNDCPCGVVMHHYHCTDCMGVYQIG